MRLALPIAAAILLAPAAAHAEDQPMRSVPMVAVGGTAIGLGALNLATSPLCVSGSIQHKTACLGLSVGFGAGLLAIGIPLVVVGAQRQPPPVMVQPTVGGAVLSWRASW